MQGTHPLTGKPIRIIQTETQIFRDKKTLVWLRDQELLPRFNRWETIVTNPSDLEKWNTALGQSPTLYICESTDALEVAELLDSKRLDNVHLMFFRKDPLISYGKEKLKAAGYQNIVCIEEIQTMYPHTFFKFAEGKTKTEEIVLAVCLLFRLQRAMGFTAFEQSNIQPYLAQTQHLNTYIGGIDEVPEQLILIQQYFRPSSREREREINHCLKNNLANPFIDKIILLNEEIYKLPKNIKLKQVIIGKRLDYWTVLQYIQKEVPNGEFVAFANSDIYLDESWKLIWSTELKDKFISLLRYEEPNKPDEEPKLFGPRADSQDTWLVHADSLKMRTLKKEDFDFEFGRAGCDNALNLSMLRAKFLVCNPCLTLRTLHCHHSGIRTYNPKDIIDKPMYLYLNPTGLHDMQPLEDLKSYEVDWTPSQPFSRKLNGDRKELRTFTTMLAKAQVYNYEPDEENRWLPPLKEKEAVYKMTNATQTYNGLVYDANKIFIGKHESLKMAWSEFNLSQLTPSLMIDTSIAVRCDDSVATNPYKYMHSYLSKIMRLRDAGYKGEFWVPRETAEKHEIFLKAFGWEDGTVPIMPRTKEIQAFSKTLYMMSPLEMSTKEDIEALRKRLRGWIATPLEKKAVIFQDDEFYDVKDSFKIEAALEEMGYETRVVYPGRTSFDLLLLAMLGASVCVSQLTSKSSSHYLYWLLPKEAVVIEGQNELEPLGEGAHEAGAADLAYWYYSMPRGKKELLRETLHDKIKNIFDKALNGTEKEVQVQENQKPLLIVPLAKDGFHGHPGDSFREMAELWEEKGYVNLQKTSSADHCWLKGIGEILLYDRPTYKWLDDIQFNMALIGNPEPLNTKPMRDWTFWPRKPRLLEAVASTKTYDERDKNCVFYGKIENSVQSEMRKGHEWGTACDDFYMAESNQPHKYTHAEYLEKLSKAKFGLCLAGYGKKCHREIECMALGTVPICSAEVDMDNYADRPIEGTHYFRIKSPMEAKVIAETTTKEEWRKMSAECVRWWRNNASAEGSWLLTKRLVGL